MKISINWLKDFVDLSGITNQELIKRLTLSTAEIEKVVDYGKNTNNVVVAKIIKREPAQNSKKLSVLKVDAGDRIYDVICGAPNCREGIRVAFAKSGGEVNGFKIETIEIAGYKSEGMCCSEKELGISENHDGIMEIECYAPLGTDIKSIYDIEDTIFEVDNKSLTNRPDLWCHYGFAREVATIFNRQLKPLEVVNLEEYEKLEKLKLAIEDSEKCYRYSGIKLGNITKKVSPINMKIRLFYAGMRSLNLLADLTNYVMLEVGQPMHAFDSKKAKNISVKTFDKPINFTTLDGEERKINKNTLMICEGNIPIAIAGIMGGLISEVEEHTTNILLESANFFATSIRKSASALSLRTEASLRYEKSLDPELTYIATARFIKLLKIIDVSIEVQSSLADVYPHKYPKLTINTSVGYIEDYCGIKIGEDKIVSILTSLGFTVLNKNENLTVTVPSFRATKDVSISADLVEEVARIYGYDNILPRAVESKIKPAEQQTEHLLEYEVKKLLAQKFALSEVHTYLWNDVKVNKQLNIQTKGFVKVLNSTVKDNDELRSELTPSLIKIIDENKNTTSEMGIFEIGRVITGLDKNNLAIEEKHLSVVLASKTKSQEELYFELKKMLEAIFATFKNKRLELKINKKVNVPYLHPINSAYVIGRNASIGQLGVMHPSVVRQIDKKFNIAAAEIDFSQFSNIKQEQMQIKELSKYQTTTLDFNFLADKNSCYFNLEMLFANFESKLDYTFKLKNVFEDESVISGKKSYTFSFEIGSKNHTLTSIEIEEFYNGLINYAKANGLELR
ncbi:MAG: phenylalanine--tRNA ligase subunit beta [Clostridia bacterium]|nr:phenylalanine--tRNA ligase subunit beta [Clostridia bacterium]